MLDDNKRKKLRVSVIAAALAALPILPAHAAGLGKLTVLSALGQPLRAELDISASREEVASITAKIASQESFRQANIEYSGVLSTLRFTLDKRSNGQPYFRLSSDRPIGDPFLDLLVELSWSSGRLIREYTFLLDPPELNKPVEMPAPVNAPVSAPAAMAPAKPEIEKPVPEATPTEKPAKKAAGMAQEKPAARPAPKLAEAPAERTAASTREVHKGDTLGKIAAETRPDGVSLDQMLVALFRSNQEAFDGGNMNRLKAGKILSVPEKDTVAAVDAGEARKVILAQAADFDAYRSKLAGAVASAKPAKEEAPAQGSSGKITPKVEDKVPAVVGKDKLQVSRTEASGDAAKTKALEEEKVAKEKALKEAQSRIAELEKNVADMRKLAELKSQAAADLQKQAAKAAPAAEAKKPEPAAKPAEAPVKAAEPPKAVEAAKPVEPPKPAEIAKAPEEVAKPAEPAKPADAPPPAVKKPVAPPPPPPEPSFLEDNGALVFGGGGALALLAGYLGFSAWKRRKSAKAVASAESVLSASSVLDVTSSEGMSQIDAQPSEFGEAAETGFGSGEGVDPIREADTFMAYGRDAQAEEILVDALAKTPENLPVYLKLLEIYAARKSVSQFNAVAEKLNEQTNGAGPEWERAVTLGRVVAPDYFLYGGGPGLSSEAAPSAAIAEEAPAAAPVAEEAAPLDLDFDLASAEPAAEPEVAPVPEVIPEAVEPAPEVAEVISTPAASEEPAALDFDLDLGAAPAAAETAESAPAPTVDAGMDLDFDLGDMTAAAPAPVEAPAAAPAAVDAGNTLDFDLDLGTSAEPVVEPAVAPVGEAVAAGGLDLDFDLDLGSPAAEAAVVAATETAGAGAAPLDFNFDLDVPAAEAAAPAMDITLDLPADAPELNLDGISLDLSEPLAEAPALVQPAEAGEADNPEVTTKLELAQAYEEMGDKEGAKELFQEVLAEGSAAQKAIAQEKLAKLG
ncbi:MAG: pilus assembly protein [Rhodocyclaceae bacterium]|nr:MAG: pilus assembly protein [Rhodocyclaceae bacterium]